MNDAARFESAIRLIDAANSEDPNTEVVDGVSRPKELVYSTRMSDRVDKLDPKANEALKLAARAQHIRRWEVPRGDYPMNRAGYHKWRNFLYKFHAGKAAEILQELGYDEDTIARVQDHLRKRNLKTDPDTQTLEDAAALVFLEYHLADFVKRDDIDEAKAIDVLKLTWKKMSEHGHKAALEIHQPPKLKALLDRALS